MAFEGYTPKDVASPHSLDVVNPADAVSASAVAGSLLGVLGVVWGLSAMRYGFYVMTGNTGGIDDGNHPPEGIGQYTAHRLWHALFP